MRHLSVGLTDIKGVVGSTESVSSIDETASQPEWEGYDYSVLFTHAELDFVIRGLFALQTKQPIEKERVQELINRLSNMKWEVSK